MDQIVEDTGGVGRKGCPFECLPSDVGVMQRTAGAVPVVIAKSVCPANRLLQNRKSRMGPKHLDPNVAQKDVRHGGRGGVGGVGKLILPNSEGVLEISARDVLLSVKSRGEFLPSHVLLSITAM